MKKENTLLLLDALACKEVARPPVWLMRQAGRYLPEYRALREKYSLTKLFHEPELAIEVTLMPLKKMALDAAIVFSDLLLIAEVFNKKVVYPDQGGPYIEAPVEKQEELFFVSEEEIGHKMSYVLQTITLLKRLLQVPLLGFCGAPFTLLSYFLQREKKGPLTDALTLLRADPVCFLGLLDRVVAVCISYIRLQIKAGADAVQVFDSWTHWLSQEEFVTYALPFWKKIQDGVADLEVPLLFFSRTNSLYPELISSMKPSAISFDEGLSLRELRQRVPQGIAVQGNYSPTKLLSGSPLQIKEEASFMARSVAGERGVIFNLGHGVLPKTPVENVAAFLEGLTI